MFLCGWTMTVCYQSRVWGACCLDLAAPGPDRSSWAAAQGSHYSCGVLALALLHTAALGVLHQLPLTVQSSLWKDTEKERAGGEWEISCQQSWKTAMILYEIIMLYTAITSHLRRTLKTVNIGFWECGGSETSYKYNIDILPYKVDMANVLTNTCLI